MGRERYMLVEFSITIIPAMCVYVCVRYTD